MSVRVYLNERVKELDGFKTKLRRNSQREEWEEHSLPGNIRLCQDNGRWYVTLDEPNEPIPTAVAGIIEEISLRGSIVQCPRREAGLYRFESAEAEITQEQQCLLISVRAKKMEDFLHLFRQIKAGYIRPKVSYEGQQEGKSQAEFEAETEMLRVEAEEFTSLKADLRLLSRRMEGGWPFCTKKEVRRKIATILDSYRNYQSR